MATDLGVTRPPAKLSRHLRPLAGVPTACLSACLRAAVAMWSWVFPRNAGPFSGLVPPTPPYTSPRPQSQRNSDLGGTSEREDTAKKWGLQTCLQKAWRREEIASEGPLLPSRRDMPKSPSSGEGRADSPACFPECLGRHGVTWWNLALLWLWAWKGLFKGRRCLWSWTNCPPRHTPQSQGPRKCAGVFCVSVTWHWNQSGRA